MRSVHTPPKRHGSWFRRIGQHCHAERPTVPSFQSETRLRRLPFLESSLRVLPANSSDSEATGLGRQNAVPGGPPAGVAVPPARRCRSRNLARTPNWHRLFWQWFGDKLAHRVSIQAPQPRLHSGLKEAQRQPAAGWARTQPACIENDLGNWTGC